MAPRLAHLLGLRVAAPTTFEQVLGVVQKETATASDPPALTCSVFEPEGALTEPLALCAVGGADLGLAALRSGQVALSPPGSVSRALLKARTLEDSYQLAETAARLERRGLWWDYPDRGGDPIAWRMRQDAQAANTGVVAVGIQAWIAQSLIVVGGIVAFLFDRRREAALERERQMYLVEMLELTIEEVEKATSVGDWNEVKALALTVTETLKTERPSPQVRRKWKAVEDHLKGQVNVATLRTFTAKFVEALKKDRSLRSTTSK